mgnify:CR=1 FL=1
MKDATKAPANAGITMSDAQDIIRRQREAHGKPVTYRPRAIDLVRNNEPVIRQLRDAGYKQEDAVLLLLDLGHDGHKPDTLRKAIAGVVGPWCSNEGDTAESTPVSSHAGKDLSPSNSDVTAPAGGGAGHIAISTERKSL